MDCMGSTILFTNEAGANVIGTVKPRTVVGSWPIKVGRNTFSLVDKVVESVLNSNHESLLGLCDVANLTHYCIESGEGAERELFIPASTVQQVVGGNFMCYALPVKLTGSTPPFAVLTNSKRLDFKTHQIFSAIADFLRRHGAGPYPHTDLGNGKFNNVPLVMGDKCLIAEPGKSAKFMPPANVKFTRLFHNGALIYEDTEGGGGGGLETAKAEPKAEPKAEKRKAEPKERAKKRPDTDYAALRTLARCAAQLRPRDDEDEFTAVVKEQILALLHSSRGKHVCYPLRHFLPPLDDLVDLIHKNTGGTGGISMDLVESELRKIKNQHECTTLVRNIDAALEAVVRGEADLAHLLGQAVPFTGRGNVADAVRRVAASPASLSRLAVQINEGWMRRKPVIEPLEPLALPPLAPLAPLALPPLEPLKPPAPLKRSVAELLSEITNFVE